VITDGDGELISAIATVWPTVQRQRCFFYLSNNVVLNIKRLWLKPFLDPIAEDDEDDAIYDASGVPDEEDDCSLLAGMLATRDGPSANLRFAQVPDEVANTRAGLFLLWQFMLYASAHEVYDQAWALLQRQTCHCYDSKPEREWHLCRLSRRNSATSSLRCWSVREDHGDLVIYIT
jgi:hypothetical protein